jgi:uncharacterized protein (TIGR03790 family)
MMKFLLAAFFLAGGALFLRAANPGDEVIVIYNTKVPESKEIANYYAAKRLVPEKQIFGFALTTNQDMSRKEFRDALQQPLAKELASRKLWRIGSVGVPATATLPEHTERKVLETKIRYAVLCYGVPLRIEADPNLKEPAREKLRPELRRDEAAVDSELALLPLVEQDLPLSGPLRNPVYGYTNGFAVDPTNGVLMVARLDAPSPEIVRGMIDRALQAETNGLWGRAYFDMRGITEPGFKIGDDWIRDAAELSQHLGYETIVDTNAATLPPGFPLSQVAWYMGWYDGEVSGPFLADKVEFMPGAFAYHLHSFNAGTLHSLNRGWAGPLLAKGATITVGTVNEPYLSGTLELGIFTSRLIFYGFTFGEAAYAAQPVLSWQTTVVGDPLYRPFGKNPDMLHRELAVRHSDLIDWSYLRLVNLNLAMHKSLNDVVVLLEGIDSTRKSAVLTEKLGDLYTAQGKPSSALHAYSEALKLNPTPQQKLRLLLTLGEKYAAAGQDADAFAAYQQLVNDYPAYPAQLAIYQKLLPLAQKLGKTTEAGKYQAEITRLTPPPPAPATNAPAGAHKP